LPVCTWSLTTYNSVRLHVESSTASSMLFCSLNLWSAVMTSSSSKAISSLSSTLAFLQFRLNAITCIRIAPQSILHLHEVLITHIILTECEHIIHATALIYTDYK